MVNSTSSDSFHCHRNVNFAEFCALFADGPVAKRPTMGVIRQTGKPHQVQAQVPAHNNPAQVNDKKTLPNSKLQT